MSSFLIEDLPFRAASSTTNWRENDELVKIDYYHVLVQPILMHTHKWIKGMRVDQICTDMMEMMIIMICPSCDARKTCSQWLVCSY